MYKFDKHIFVLYNSFKLLQKHSSLTKFNLYKLSISSGNKNNINSFTYFKNILFLYQLTGKKLCLLKIKKSVSNFNIFKDDFLFVKSSIRKFYFINLIKIFHYNSIFSKKINKQIGLKTINFGISNLNIYKQLYEVFNFNKNLTLIGKNITITGLDNSFLNLFKIYL